MTPAEEAELVAAARAAFGNAYAPYSAFHVGAAVRADDGAIYSGCNVENATFGATVCAERNAVAAAVRAGARRLVACAVVTHHDHPASPCGICRQVLREFAVDLPIVSVTTDGDRAEWTLAQLLPESFGPEDLATKA